MKIILIIIYIILNYLALQIQSQLTPSASSTLSIKEVYYSNGSNVFWVTPITTFSSNCYSYIPFQVVSTEYPITNLVLSPGVDKTYESSDSKEIALNFVSSSYPIDYVLNSSFSFSENGIAYTFNFRVNCYGIDFSNLKYEITNPGLLYNSLAFNIKFDLFPSRTNVKLIFKVGDAVTQSYIGDNQYFVSFQHNYESFFTPDSNNNIILSIVLAQGLYNISINSPFKYSNDLPTISSSTGFDQDSSYLVISNFTTFNNHFISNTFSSKYINEPFLIYSKNNIYTYLKASSVTPLSPSVYYLYLYKSTGLKLLVSNSVSTTGITYPTLSMPQTDVVASVTIFTFTFSTSTNPYLIEMTFPYVQFRYPFGLIAGTYANPQYSVSFMSLEVVKNPKLYYLTINNVTTTVTIPIRNEGSPGSALNIINYSIDLIEGGKMMVSFSVDNIYQFGSITLWDTISTSYITIERDKFSTDMPFEFIIPRISIYKIVVTSSYQLITNYLVSKFNNNQYMLDNQLQSFPTVESIDELELKDFDYSTGLKNVSFLFNDLVVTDRGVSNKMYITLVNYPTSREVKATFIYSDYRVNEKKDIAYSTFNPTTNQFEFEFNIPKNIKTGNVSYTITLDSLGYISYYSYSLPSEYQLRISESNNIDLYGPIVSDIKIFKLPDQNINVYTIEISDTANGFKFGYILVRGSIDMSERNITITPSNLYAGTILKGGYYLEQAYDNPCIEQTFTIVYAYFEDTEGYSTEYDVLKLSTKSPFYLFGLNKDILSIAVTCSNVISVSAIAPDIIELNVPTLKIIDQKQETRIFSFNYTATHPDGLSSTYLPTLYLLNINNNVFPSTSTVILSSNSTHCQYSSIVKLPFYFVPNPRIAIYGFVSKSGANSGFTPPMLATKSLNSYFLYSLNFGLVITGSSKLSSTGLGGLWLYGVDFSELYSCQIQYTDEENGGVYKTITPESYIPTSIFFNTIRPTTKPINIILTDTSLRESDPYTVYPVIYDFTPPPNNNSSSLCKGTPLCGGPSQGTCISTGCKCILPWTGDDCMSRIIQIDPPTVNETNPSTNITTGEHATVNSIVSIIGIKELSINSNEVNRYYFEEWILTPVLNDSYITRYTYSSFIKKDDIKVSNITVTLDWYKVESTIQFANEELHINPSSIKYTIKISNYPFSSQLNTLQLIMKASIQTSNSESCSDKQISESNDADYFKLQVDEFSFYCRFIKRCQLDDNKVTKLTNTLLDSEMNETSTNNHQTSQSYIGINIPFFNDNVVIDPDFSIILDSNSAQSKCKGDSGLTTPQLAGIIVGSICFFIVLVIISGAIIYKSPGCMSVKIRVYKLFRGSK